MSPPAEDAEPAEWLASARRAIHSQAIGILRSAHSELLTALEAAVPWGNPDSGELVVDIEALVHVFANLPNSEGTSDEAGWLARWLQETGLSIPTRNRIGTQDAATLRPTLSRSIRGTLLPNARRLRDGDGGADQPVRFRDVFLALTQYTSRAWPPAWPRPVNEPDLDKLRAYLATRQTKAPPEAPAQAGLPESTPLLSDNPSADDLLGRRPLVQALAIRLMRLQAEEAASPEPAAVMVHLHGAWGSGKSSMVKLLAEELGKAHPRWLVVDFNAWRNTRVKPPWWNMLADLKRAQARRLLADVMPLRWLWLQLRWAWVSPAVDHWLIVAGLVAATALLGALLGAGPALAGLLSALLGRNSAVIREMLSVAGPIIAGAGVVVATLRSMLLGGRRVAESFEALRIDSYRPFIDLFALLTGITRTPVLIVLDDLDRCDAGTVTDLLEGIQTLFRGAPVVFLAVADRRWITTSFGKRFADFQDAGGDAARPVGDLFLDKMFQLSVGVPQVGDTVQARYLRHLLGVATPPPPAPPPPLPPDVRTLEAGQAAVANASPDQRAAVAAQVALRLSEARSDAITQHRLLRWASFIEANPRAMKRLVNAVGMAQTRTVLEERAVDFDTLALWTMLELRWPRAADAIAAEPSRIDREDDDSHPMLAAVWTDPLFRRLASELDAGRVAELLGRPDDGTTAEA